jgi:hypothetical protein
MTGYTSADLSNLGALINLAQTELAAGNQTAAIGTVESYYTYQVSTRGYATDALEVVSDSGAYGIGANQLLVNQLGGAQWSAEKATIAVQLASADFTAIGNNPSSVPTEAQIEAYHAQVFEANNIPLTAWGGAALGGFRGHNIELTYGLCADRLSPWPASPVSSFLSFRTMSRSVATGGRRCSSGRKIIAPIWRC